ncbi:MAG: hypothetical protein U0176_21020, partial [Bacteroidia bacterium]
MPSPIHILTHLRCNKKFGVIAPHKPVLMLAILEAYRRGLLKSNRVAISPELVALFKQIWAQLAITTHQPNMSYPFYHLTGDGFWTLIPRTDVEVVQLLGSKAKNLATLDAAVDHAVIRQDVAEWMLDANRNELLEQALLDTYFPTTSYRFEPQADLPDLTTPIQKQLLETSAYEYREQIKIYMAAEDGEGIYLRCATFKRLIPQI